MTTQCPKCRGVVTVVGDAPRMHQLFDVKDLWPKGYPCVFGCEGMSELVGEPDDESEFSMLDLTPEQYFRALHGGGLPDELAFDYHTVRGLLEQEPITGIVLRDWGAGVRPGIERLSTESHEIHLSASPTKGVQVFKVTTRR